ncbi:MAG: hypothetical protein IJT07_04050 [Oscillospiraceae bacterium]|nr:hypothetical protein [Oscillospiraceae bacterium]
MEKKTVKVQFVSFWRGCDPMHDVKLAKVLQKHYNVEISDHPDYLIIGPYEPFYDYVNYPCVRILTSGENYMPDLNLVDYAISPYPISLYDRCFRQPVGLYNTEKCNYCIERKKKHYDKAFLAEKTVFANFCASHESEHNLRGDFFKALCNYKKVDSIGTYLNNTGVTVSLHDGTKVANQKKCKFTLCFESTADRGFNTEKLVDAFASDTIPVYYGDPEIGEIFNTAAFINVADYASFDEAIEKIKELDQDDEKYLAMMNQPVFVNPEEVASLDERFEQFVLHIFEQPLEQAYRRCRVYYPISHELFLRRGGIVLNGSVAQMLKRIKNVFYKKGRR